MSNQITAKSSQKDLQIAAPTIMSKIMSKLTGEIPGFQNIAAGKYFQRKLLTYEDTDGRVKLALSLVFVQDLNEPIENLDKLVFGSVTDSLEKMKLTKVVNDVVVNLIHTRDGKAKA